MEGNVCVAAIFVVISGDEAVSFQQYCFLMPFVQSVFKNLKVVHCNDSPLPIFASIL